MAISIWIPLFSSITGGVLVWAGQFIERTYRRKQDIKKDLLEIYAFCRKLEAMMRNNYRELAMAKIQVEYWWHCHRVFHSTPNSPNYYEEHLKSQVYAREIERQIGLTKADFISHVRKFEALKKIPKSIEQDLAIIEELSNPKAKTYETELPHQTVRYNLVEKDEAELRSKYFENLDHFRTINEALQSLL